MSSALPSLWLLLSVAATPVETRFVQVEPPPPTETALVRSPGMTRAVVLIHGLHLHPFHKSNPAAAAFRPWQLPGSHLVRLLARDSDVFAFSYGQTVPVDELAAMPDLADRIRQLRQLGYHDVALVGFSAGGLIVRQYVEDCPDPGVTRVIQVCAPNTGSSWAKIKAGAGPGQEVFVRSLTKQARAQALKERQGKTIPPTVQFTCVVGNGLIWGDGLVSTHSQWPDDLQRQGIPAVAVNADHHQAVAGERGAQVIARLVREDQRRWPADQVAAMRERLFGRRAGAVP